MKLIKFFFRVNFWVSFFSLSSKLALVIWDLDKSDTFAVSQFRGCSLLSGYLSVTYVTAPRR